MESREPDSKGRAWPVRGCCYASALLVVSATFYMAYPPATELVDSAIPADPIAWLINQFVEPGPPAIGEIGHLVNGKFEDVDRLLIWEAPDRESLVGVDPSVWLHGRIIRPCPEDGAEPAPEVMARILSVRADGNPLSPGVLARFVLVSHDKRWATYHSDKPLLLIQNAKFEGENRELIAIYSDERCWTRIVLP